jgi:hypothetical protein
MLSYVYYINIKRKPSNYLYFYELPRIAKIKTYPQKRLLFSYFLLTIEITFPLKARLQRIRWILLFERIAPTLSQPVQQKEFHRKQIP